MNEKKREQYKEKWKQAKWNVKIQIHLSRRATTLQSLDMLFWEQTYNRR